MEIASLKSLLSVLVPIWYCSYMIAVIAPSAASHVMFCKVMRGSVAMICVNISGYFCVIFHYNFRMAVTNTSTYTVRVYIFNERFIT